MSVYKLRSIATYTAGGWQAYQGPGVLTHAVYDGTGLSSNVLNLYDSANAQFSTETSLSTWTTDTDFGTTVPVSVFLDGRVVATLGTASANTGFGIPFARGLFVNKTGDVTNNLALKFLIKPLIRKSVTIGGLGAATGSINIFDGPGVIHGIRIRVSQAEVAAGTLDFLFKDSHIGGSGNTIITGTDYVTAGPRTLKPVTTTGVDDVGAAVTTAATGAYTNPGVAFVSGLNLSFTGANTTVGVSSADVDVLIEG